MSDKDLKGIIFVAVLLIVGLSTPVVKEYLDRLFNAFLTAFVIAVIILIVGGVIWFFFFRDRDR